MKNVNKAIKEYSEAVKQAKGVCNQAVKHIEQNYVKGSSLYNSAIDTAQGIFDDAIRPLKKACLQQVKDGFEKTRTAISNIVVTAPSEELLALLPMIKDGKMTETEVQMFADKFSGSYMNEKLIADAMKKPFKTIEGMMCDVDRLEAKVNDFFDNYKGDDLAKISIQTATMMYGKPVELMDETVNEFLTKYADQE